MLLAKKSLGQNFLKHPRIAERMVSVLKISKGDLVYEVGPGTGVLTRALLALGARVVAIEKDARAIPLLKETFREEVEKGSLEIIEGDALSATPAILQKEPYTIAANIPYYITGAFIENTLSSAHPPQRMVLMVQKEVAERIARSKKESILSISVKAYGTPRYIATVAKGNFSPVPNVDSAILLIEDISKTRFTAVDEAFFFTVLKAGFSEKRKRLLKNLLKITTALEVERVAKELSLNPQVRAEDVSVDTWFSIARSLA